MSSSDLDPQHHHISIPDYERLLRAVSHACYPAVVPVVLIELEEFLAGVDGVTSDGAGGLTLVAPNYSTSNDQAPRPLDGAGRARSPSVSEGMRDRASPTRPCRIAVRWDWVSSGKLQPAPPNAGCPSHRQLRLTR